MHACTHAPYATASPRTTMAATHLLRLLVLLLLLPPPFVLALTQDGVLLLSFKFSLLTDPFASLAGWGYADDTPCSWNGVVCSLAVPSASNDSSSSSSFDSGGRVIGLIMPNAQLVGPIARELGLIEHLRHLDLSGNALNGTLPPELFRAAELRVLSLADNGIAGPLPELVGQLRSLRALNLAGNVLSGAIPVNLTLLPNLTAVSLASNYFSGGLPGGMFPALQVLDVSSNLLNGTLPPDFGGKALRYVNLSSNRLAGGIPPEMASRLPSNITIDLSYNNITGAIPALPPFTVQRPTAFDGNTGLCGRPLKNLCAVPSTASNSPNGTAGTESPPAIAAIPKNLTEALPGGDSNNEGGAPGSGRQGGLRVATIVAIAIGDVAGIAVLLVVFLYVYQLKKKRQQQELQKQSMGVVFKKQEPDESLDIGRSLSCCLRKKAGNDSDDTEEASDASTSLRAQEGVGSKNKNLDEAAAKKGKQTKQDGAVLVTVDGEAELEVETLLKASAYILGAGGTSIVYKAVLANGTVLAVRRIASEDGRIERFHDFDSQVRAIAKLRHSNVLRLRGFYWGPEERLLIHDFAANGSLADVPFKRKPGGASPGHLSWSARLRIARGVARGLAYLHDKKWVHGNVRPSNILLDADMEPLLADLGLHRLVRGADRLKPAMSGQQFGSKRSARSLPDLSPPPGASPLGSSSSSADGAAHYQAPEAVKSPRPTTKWDVYSFGMMLLELAAGRALTSLELCQWSAGFAAEEKGQAFLLADPALQSELEGREEALVGCFKLGFACCAMAPQKRPSMKDVLQALDRMPPSSQ